MSPELIVSLSVGVLVPAALAIFGIKKVRKTDSDFKSEVRGLTDMLNLELERCRAENVIHAQRISALEQQLRQVEHLYGELERELQRSIRIRDRRGEGE